MFWRLSALRGSGLAGQSNKKCNLLPRHIISHMAAKNFVRSLMITAQEMLAPLKKADQSKSIAL
ncbi:hypothetical protein [Sphingobium sp. SCG-1]|uniref:hypothetical protein n=1 Tax=Sphingobium sp. SCG-1 TaxID=2072936 RepID=UPI001671564F|nr:hypothetical protein [Sphingobium sp. SCG-1]